MLLHEMEEMEGGGEFSGGRPIKQVLQVGLAMAHAKTALSRGVSTLEIGASENSSPWNARDDLRRARAVTVVKSLSDR